MTRLAQMADMAHINIYIHLCHLCHLSHVSHLGHLASKRKMRKRHFYQVGTWRIRDWRILYKGVRLPWVARNGLEQNRPQASASTECENATHDHLCVCDKQEASSEIVTRPDALSEIIFVKQERNRYRSLLFVYPVPGDS